MTRDEPLAFWRGCLIGCAIEALGAALVAVGAWLVLR